MSTGEAPHGSDVPSLNDDSVRVTEREFLKDPAAYARRADEVPHVVVTSDDGEHVRFVIIQQREPLDLK